MRLATFNVENLFQRAKAMNLSTQAEGKAVLQDFARLNVLIQSPKYTPATKNELLKIMKRNQGILSKGESKFIRLRENRSKLVGHFKSRTATIVADGRGDWSGWFDLERESVDEAATENTARVIKKVAADVQCIIEAEDRPGLKRFNDEVLPKVAAVPFDHVMLIDGNDDRGIDVGIMCRKEHEIIRMMSHVDDKDGVGTIFSRDCAEYEMDTPLGGLLLVLVNHFKSKGYGNAAESAKKRRRQAQRVREIYDLRVAQSYEHIAIVGDFNEIPSESPMDPLLRNGSTLVDIMSLPKFVGDGRPGTHGNGTASSKLDYILLSPKLAAKVTAGGIERSGVWGGKNGTLFPHMPTIHSAKEAASDHAALWVDLDL